MKSIARKKEVTRLSEALRSADYELILVYGRRHVGDRLNMVCSKEHQE